MTAHVGIDVSSKHLQVAVMRDGEVLWEDSFTNTPTGRQALLKRLAKLPDERVQAVVEATSIYSLDISLALHDAPERVEVMVANPRQVAHFAKAAAQRGKTDPLDAVLLARFSASMPFVAWQPPAKVLFDLRQLMRRVDQYTRALAKEKTRLKGLKSTATTDALLREDLEEHIVFLEERIKRLEDEALKLVRQDEVLSRHFDLLTTAPGIATRSGLRILAEVSVLPRDMQAKQLVAHAGLDPRPWSSGDMRKRTRISKQGNAYLRKALFLPAMTAIQHSPEVRAFRDRLVENGKTPKQATIAVMRKLLHAIWGMFHHDQAWDGQRFTNRREVDRAA